MFRPDKRTKPHIVFKLSTKIVLKNQNVKSFYINIKKIFFSKLPISLPGVVGGIRLEVVSIEEVIDILF